MKKLYWWVGGLIVVISLGLFGAGMYFYQVAVVPSPKSFLSGTKSLKPSDPLYENQEWFKHVKKDRWTEMSATDHLKLDAYYIPAAEKTPKTAILIHGFMNNKNDMDLYAFLYHKLGYNVLIPDDRGLGDSQGNYIGYGWPDRLDYKKWINQVIAKNGQNSQIVLMGVSMGGATVMMISGEKLPPQVKAFVEDCGYTSVWDEIVYQAKQLYHLPSFPLVNIVSGITQVRAGYNFKEASSINQLKKNTRPMLFIHGEKDTFVPAKMVYKNYQATKGPKKLVVVKNAAHANSYEQNPKLYEQVTRDFLNQYVK